MHAHTLAVIVGTVCFLVGVAVGLVVAVRDYKRRSK